MSCWIFRAPVTVGRIDCFATTHPFELGPQLLEWPIVQLAERPDHAVGQQLPGRRVAQVVQLHFAQRSVEHAGHLPGLPAQGLIHPGDRWNSVQTFQLLDCRRLGLCLADRNDEFGPLFACRIRIS